ncbi:MAG: DUF4124 domain-containing protein [Syntrophobacterales bacterium]|nr:MAG: DUF4124 domain-containing protein [Syntrophobacterales bacterium]
MKYFAILTILICSILLPMGADGEIYKWVDKSGNPHFSDTPPPTGEVIYETVKEVSYSSQNESGAHSRKIHVPSSSSPLFSGKPLYFWRDQFEMLNSKISMKRNDIRLLKSAIDKTDMYRPEKKSGMIIYPRELRVDGRLLKTRDQFIEEWTRQTEQLGELEGELRKLRENAKLAGVPRWVWED